MMVMTTEKTLSFHLISSKLHNEGHKLTIDGSYTKNKDNEDSTIDGVNLTFQIKLLLVQRLIMIQEQFQFQTDYVLPTGEGSQFEAG
jgi:hypothetical protein